MLEGYASAVDGGSSLWPELGKKFERIMLYARRRRLVEERVAPDLRDDGRDAVADIAGWRNMLGEWAVAYLREWLRRSAHEATFAARAATAGGMDGRDGWGPLCKALNLPVPANLPVTNTEQSSGPRPLRRLEQLRGDPARALRPGWTAAMKFDVRIVLRHLQQPLRIEQDERAGPRRPARRWSGRSARTCRVEVVALDPARLPEGEAIATPLATRYSDFSRAWMTSNCSTPTAPRMGSRSMRWRSKNSWTAPSSESCSSPFFSCLRFSGSSQRDAHEVLRREAGNALELERLTLAERVADPQHAPSQMPTMSPEKASSMTVRSWAMNWTGRASVEPSRRTCVQRLMPRWNLPEQMRTKAIRSRCRGSMFAWILNTKPEKPGASAPARRSRSCGRGGGASSTKRSRNGSTPKLFMALPKNTGVTSPGRNTSRSNGCAALSSSASSSISRRARSPRASHHQIVRVVRSVMGARRAPDGGPLEGQQLAVQRSTTPMKLAPSRPAR